MRGLSKDAAQSVHLLRGLEMGRPFRILARKEFRADHGRLSLLIADHPQPQPFAIKPCHHTRLEARACSRGSGDMQEAFTVGQELHGMQSEGSQAQNLDGSHFCRSRQSALRNQLDPGRGPLDGMPSKSHLLRAWASSSRPWEQPGLIRRSAGDAGLTLVAGRGPKNGGNLELG